MGDRVEKKDRKSTSQYSAPQRKPRKKTLIQRLKENMGSIERTTYPANLTKDYSDIDQYWEALDALAGTLCLVWQPNPKYRKAVKDKMELVAPASKDEYELVKAYFVERTSDLGEFKNQKAYLNALEMLTSMHREFQKEARTALHDIRTFLRTDYPTLVIYREELEDLRFEMDALKHEQKACKDPQVAPTKAAEVEAATTAYQNKLKEVIQMVEDFPENRDSHLKELTEWATINKRYHERSASVILTMNQ